MWPALSCHNVFEIFSGHVETKPGPSQIVGQVGAGSIAERQEQVGQAVDELCEASSGLRAKRAAGEES